MSLWPLERRTRREERGSNTIGLPFFNAVSPSSTASILFAFDWNFCLRMSTTATKWVDGSLKNSGCICNVRRNAHVRILVSLAAPLLLESSSYPN
jgi:hypothetical protein